jgi:exo-beta-1,3-glucanase (GH17 family)
MPFVRARAAILLLLALAAMASAWYWVALGVPVAMPAAASGRIACVSYAPYRKAGESPFTPGYTVTAARIDEDLKALSRRFDCVRTYSVGQGLDQVPAIARRYGMKVLLGAWLSRNQVENAEELTMAIEVANRERDVIRAIVVGNEVLLRGELPQRTIAEHLRMVKAATGLPVTYADVWEFWIKYREVAPAVDFITIHILPYWEDEPVPIEHAIDHVDAIYKKMQATFPGREFLIGETGWPSEGRQRWEAVPSRVNEARFFREFMNFVERSHLPYNVIEAFDQPWKRALEGTVGGYWGLYDDDLRDKFALTGPVVEEPRWWMGLTCGALFAIGFAAVGLVGRRESRGSLAARVLAGFFIGAMAAAQVRHMTFANRDAFEWALTVSVTSIAVVTALIVTQCMARWMSGDGATTGAIAVASAPMTEAWSRLPSMQNDRSRRLNGALQAFWLVAATIVNLLLVFDARYRDFPSLLFAPVIVAYVALALARREWTWRARRQIEECMLVGALLLAACVILVMELPINASADLWTLLCVAFAGATWINAATPISSTFKAALAA